MEPIMGLLTQDHTQRTPTIRVPVQTWPSNVLKTTQIVHVKKIINSNFGKINAAIKCSDRVASMVFQANFGLLEAGTGNKDNCTY